MKWTRLEDLFILAPNCDDIKVSNCNNFKISNKICEFYYSDWLPLDDISNITYDISIPVINSINIDFSKDSCITSKNHIRSIKLDVNLYIEYTSTKGIKILTLNSRILDFLVDDVPNSYINIVPKLLCLWKDTNNNFNLSISYILYKSQNSPNRLSIIQ